MSVTMPSNGEYITYNDWNNIVNMYNNPESLDLQYSYKGPNELITSNDWLSLHDAITQKATSLGKDFETPLPLRELFEEGKIIQGELTWPDVYVVIPQTDVTLTSDYEFIVPPRVNSIIIRRCIGAGGGGGRGNEKNNGAGGGGGGSGGFQGWDYEGTPSPPPSMVIIVSPGDIVNFYISNVGGTTNSDGGDTYITVNGVEKIRSTGGEGGHDGYLVPSIRHEYPPSDKPYDGKGGIGGTPNGYTGGDGEIGTNDYSSGRGGHGININGSLISSPTPFGSAPNVGQRGAGAPGAGFTDRTSPWRWNGGTGGGGLVIFRYKTY